MPPNDVSWRIKDFDLWKGFWSPFLLGNESCGIHKLEILPEIVKDTKCYELDSRGKPEAAGEVEVLQR